MLEEDSDLYSHKEGLVSTEDNSCVRGSRYPVLEDGDTGPINMGSEPDSIFTAERSMKVRDGKCDLLWWDWKNHNTHQADGATCFHYHREMWQYHRSFNYQAVVMQGRRNCDQSGSTPGCPHHSKLQVLGGTSIS